MGGVWPASMIHGYFHKYNFIEVKLKITCMQSFNIEVYILPFIQKSDLFDFYFLFYFFGGISKAYIRIFCEEGMQNIYL
jgi:hypothetical protein